MAIVEWMDEREAVRRLEVHRVEVGVRVAVAEEHDFGAERANGA